MKTAKVVEELVKIKIELEQHRTYTAMSRVDSLIEKLCDSREGRSTTKSVSKSHHMNCMLEMDPDYYGPCTCFKYDKSSDHD